MKKEKKEIKQPDSQSFHCVRCNCDIDSGKEMTQRLKDVHKVPDKTPMQKEMVQHIDGAEYFMGTDKYTIKSDNPEIDDIIFYSNYYYNRKKKDIYYYTIH